MKPPINLDYVYNDKDPEANTRDFSHVASLSTSWAQEHWNLWTDLRGRRLLFPERPVGPGADAVLRFSAQATGWRYTRLESDGDNGLRLNRYESSVVAVAAMTTMSIFSASTCFSTGTG